jgi:multiple sugar transport system ATP-binding protein
MAAIGIEHVTKRYGDVTAVRDLSLEVRDGEFMVLLGPSGCGKTTTLRLIAGLERVTEGRIRIGDTVVNDLSPGRRDIAMVFQSAGGLFPHLDVYRNLAFPLQVRSTPRREIATRVEGAGGRFGLAGLMRRRPPQLSFGHREEVALARGLMRQPRAILLDQPVTNLDAAARTEARARLRRLHQELRTTMICTTHDQAEALALGDRLAVMRDGALEQLGSARGVYEYPANLFVARFIGSPPMNLLPVVMEGRVARAAAFAVELPRPASVQRAVLGIRPEALSEIVPEGAPVVEVRADLIEMIGAHQLVHGTAGPDRLVARVARSLVVFRGDVVRLAIDVDRLHLFDAATGRTLL